MKRVTLIAAAVFAAACQGTTDPIPVSSSSADGRSGNGGGSGGGGSSSDERCVGTVTGTFENLYVPVGETCTLQNSTVNGNIKALPESRLYMTNNRVEGNIDGDEAVLVHVSGGTVGGSIQIKEANNSSEVGASVSGGTVLTQGNIQVEKMNTGGIRIADVVLTKGSIKVEENITQSSFEVVGNRVAQNVQVFKNRGPNQKFVRNNVIGQIVQCKENENFTGGPNQAGDAQDQCF